MIEGHGDDRFRYADIRMNFSSNIYGHADLSELYRFMHGRMDSIASYPAPSPKELERELAREYEVDEENVMVTNGATEAIYHTASTLRAFGHKTYKVFHPTFSEYADASRIYGYVYADDAHVCWLCNPNNPTGGVTDCTGVEQLAERHPWLVVDLSYEDYTLQPMMSAKDPLADEALCCSRLAAWFHHRSYRHYRHFETFFPPLGNQFSGTGGRCLAFDPSSGQHARPSVLSG